MKLSQMHPDQSGSSVTGRVIRATAFRSPQVDRFQTSFQPFWQNSRQSGTAHHAFDDVQHAGGTLAPLCREVAFPGCVFAGGLIDKLQEPLAAEERSDIENAVLKRQREFIAGRTSARIALAQMGYANQPVPRKVSRAPLWPEGVVGSISHNSHYCVAVTSSSSRYKGVGIDIESPVGLSPDLVDLVCTSKEKEFLIHRPDPVRGKLAKLFFSAKESVYKCIFPIFKEPLEFEDVEIVFDLEARTFQAILKTGAHGRVKTINGRFASSDKLLLTLAVLPSSLPSAVPRQLLRPATATCRESIRCQSTVDNSVFPE
jgi:4'-phosphopantetheinyl transferase EntD